MPAKRQAVALYTAAVEALEKASDPECLSLRFLVTRAVWSLNLVHSDGACLALSRMMDPAPVFLACVGIDT